MKLDKIKEAAEDFGYLQYLILVEKYRNFCEKICESINPDKGKEVENFESVKTEIENIQMKIKDLCDHISKRAKQVIKTKSSVYGLRNPNENSNLPNIDKEFTEKSDKIRESARALGDGSGNKLDLAKLRKMINPILYNDKDKENIK